MIRLTTDHRSLATDYCYTTPMYPEDRVLVAYVPRRTDFDHIERQRWYHVRQAHAPKGLYAEYIAFYFGSSFGERKHAIYCYARNLGHELTTRRDLFPHQPDHPRADQRYYRLQLGPLQWCAQPIVNHGWRRLLFLHTTWDRFTHAADISDLTRDGAPFVDRAFHALREAGRGTYLSVS